MAVSTSEDSDVLSEINITPLVDVMLVLLVAFVITIPALTNAIHVNLPRTVNTTPPDEQKAITITVDNGGSVYFDDQPVATEAISQRLAQHQGGHCRSNPASAGRRSGALRCGGESHGRNRALRNREGLGTHRQPMTPLFTLAVAARGRRFSSRAPNSSSYLTTIGN